METKINKNGVITLKMPRSHAILLLSVAAKAMRDAVQDIGQEDNITSQCCQEFAEEFWAAHKEVVNY